MADAPFDYVAMQSVAFSLLTQFGQTMNIRRVSKASGTDWDPTQTSTDYPTVGIITNLMRWYPAFTGNNDVLRTDRAGLVAASPLDTLAFIPLPFDGCVDQLGRVWKIIDVKPIYPGAVNVIYIFQLRV
jgi:hypothetical protein